MLPGPRIVPGATDPRCTGHCKGERGAADSPARPGHLGDGTKVLWCPCCQGVLRPEGPLDVQGRAPNLLHGINAKHRRFIDDICDYNVVVLKDLMNA